MRILTLLLKLFIMFMKSIKKAPDQVIKSINNFMNNFFCLVISLCLECI